MAQSTQNGFLSSLDKVPAFFGNVLETYSTFQDAKTARKIQEAQIATPNPAPSTITSPIETPRSILDDPNIRQLFTLGVVATLGLVLLRRLA